MTGEFSGMLLLSFVELQQDLPFWDIRSVWNINIRGLRDSTSSTTLYKFGLKFIPSPLVMAFFFLFLPPLFPEY